jgi:hypothetical protein
MRKATKKFQLNKETIANLENGVLTDIVGGGGRPGGTNLYTGCNTFCSCPDTK